MLTGDITADTVEPVLLTSERGGTATLQTPWASGLQVHVVGTGESVPVKQDPDTSNFFFDTVAGTSYKIEQVAAV